MVRINLKGIARVTAKGRTYWYAWRGGPRLCGDPGSPEFVQSYNEAIENRRTRTTADFTPSSFSIEPRAITLS